MDVVGTSEKEDNYIQLLFLAYAKEEASHKQVFFPGFPASAEITHIYCGWSWQMFVMWVRYESLISWNWCQEEMKVKKNKKLNIKIFKNFKTFES